jgi:RNA recognition motif-containing protein
MATKLFIGKLPYSTDDSGLNELFAQFGTVVSASVIIDRATNKSKGFGFVEMEDDAAAQKAIEELNNKDFGGQTLVVSVAKPREDKPERREAGFRRSW